MAVNHRKVTVAIGKAEYAWAERQAKLHGTSISSVLTAAAREKREADERDARQRAAWAEYEKWADAASGPLTEQELATARRVLDATHDAAPRHATPRVPRRAARRRG